MADKEESDLYIELLKGTVLNLQDRLNKEKKRLAECNMYSTQPVYSYHKQFHPTCVKPPYASSSLVFVNPKMRYTKVNSEHPSKTVSIPQAATSTYFHKKYPKTSVNRTLINKNITLKKGPLNNSKTNVNVAPISSQCSTSISTNQSSKSNQLKISNSVSKSRTPIQCEKSTVSGPKVTLVSATCSKSTPEKVLKPHTKTCSNTAKTCISPKLSSATNSFSLSKSKNIFLKSPSTLYPLKSRLVQRHRYKIVREHKPAIIRTVTPVVTPKSSLIKSPLVNTRFNLVKKPETGLHKTVGYSYVSKRCLQKAKVISLSNSEAGKSYIKKLRKLIIDAGKKFDKKPLVMVSKRKISRVPLKSTSVSKRKSGLIPHKSKLKIDHRRRWSYNLKSSKVLISSLAAKHKLSPENQKKWYLGAKRFINTKFSNLQTVTVQGVKYRVEAGGKNLRRLETEPKTLQMTKKSLVSRVSRIHIGGAIFTRTSTGVLKRISTHKLIVANRAVNKSIATAVAKNKKTQSQSLKKPCLYYNNFGKCKNVKCPYVHDPQKIAICRRMIQGTCKVLGCPFYHKLAKEKMPTCFYFLKGKCNRDNCIYPHVKVNKNAKACEDFLNGYCNRGEKCTMKHVSVCQKFLENQVCSHIACKFKARQINKSKMSASSNKTSDSDLGKKKSISSLRSSLKKSSKLVPSSEPVPISANLSFISLGNSSEDSLLDVSIETPSNSTIKEQPKEVLRIRPRL